MFGLRVHLGTVAQEGVYSVVQPSRKADPVYGDDDDYEKKEMKFEIVRAGDAAMHGHPS